MEFLFAQLPPVHLEWNISAGNIAVILAMLFFLRKIKPFYDAFVVFMAEHALLMEDLAERKNIPPEELHRLAIANAGYFKGNALKAMGKAAAK